MIQTNTAMTTGKVLKKNECETAHFLLIRRAKMTK